MCPIAAFASETNLRCSNKNCDARWSGTSLTKWCSTSDPNMLYNNPVRVTNRLDLANWKGNCDRLCSSACYPELVKIKATWQYGYDQCKGCNGLWRGCGQWWTTGSWLKRLIRKWVVNVGTRLFLRCRRELDVRSQNLSKPSNSKWYQYRISKVGASSVW